MTGPEGQVFDEGPRMQLRTAFSEPYGDAPFITTAKLVHSIKHSLVFAHS